MSGRLHYIDRCRALLMLLGIPYHSARMFSSDWGPPQGEVSRFCEYVAQTLNEFRMPAFFLIAGFFASLVLARSTPRRWLNGRMIRLGVPLATATIVLLPLQMLVVPTYHGSSLSDVLLRWTNRMSELSENWISHLWFLHDLIIYSVLFALAWPLVSRLLKMPVPAVVGRWPFVTLFAIVFIVAVPLTLAAPIIDATSVGHVANRLLRNGVFFVLGAALFFQRDMLDRWLVWSWTQAAGVAALIAAAVVLTIDGDHYRPAMLAGWFAAIGGTWLVLAAMKRWGDEPSERVTLLVNASLVIYLFHHPIIYLLGGMTERTALPSEVEWLAVCVLTFFLSLGVYLVIRRSPAVLFLFNGQPAPNTRHGAVAAVSV